MSVENSFREGYKPYARVDVGGGFVGEEHEVQLDGLGHWGDRG